MTTGPASPGPGCAASGRWSVRLAVAHGTFYVVTSLWPLVHLPSFELVTGPKTDDWLVQTVGALLAVFGAALALAGLRKRLTPEWRLLAAAIPLVLSAIDVVFVARDVISPIYLVDAAGEILLAIAWGLVSQADVRRTKL